MIKGVDKPEGIVSTLDTRAFEQLGGRLLAVGSARHSIGTTGLLSTGILLYVSA